MQGILNTGLDFWQFLSAVIAIIFGIVAIRISFKFDINKYLEVRSKSNSVKLQNACPHLTVVKNSDGKYGLQSEFISPPGTIQWACQRCGLVKYMQDDELDRHVDYFINNIDEFTKKNKKFTKLLKKSGMV